MTNGLKIRRNYDANVFHEAAEDIRVDTGVDKITFEKLKETLLSIKNCETAGLDKINSELLLSLIHI